MKTKKKLLIMLVAVIILVATLLTACTNPSDKNNDTNDTTTSATGEQTVPEETSYDPLADIPVEDFNNYTFSILTPSRTWAIVNMTASDITGDTIQDTIYQRQIDIEERLRIRLEETITTNDISQRLMELAIASGDDSYDLALLQTYNALNLYKKNYIYDQTQLDRLDLSNPWWEQSFNADVNIGNKRYITFGNANLIYYSSFYIFCFNKEMIGSYGLEDPYELVSDGKWTWEKAYTMMQTVATDNNSDGMFSPGEDIMGLTGHINHSRNLILSSGITLTTRDTDGLPVWNGLSSQYITAFEKFTEYFINSPYCAIAGKQPSPYAGYTSTSGIANYIQVFTEGRSLFLTTGTNEVTTLRDSETEYGIVVVPKFDESQADYVTPVYSATEGFVIPTSAGDVERTALILETLGALSYQNLVDKHIGTVLHYKVSKDPTAIEMINLAYASGAVDTAMANDFGTCTSILNNLNVYGSTTISSTFKMIDKKIRSDIEAAVSDIN